MIKMFKKKHGYMKALIEEVEVRVTRTDKKS